MGQIATIGLDIAKSVFQVHGVDGTGEVILRRRLTRARLLGIFHEAVTVLGGDRGLRYLAPLGTRTTEVRPRCPPDAAELRQAYPRRRGTKAEYAAICDCSDELI